VIVVSILGLVAVFVWTNAIGTPESLKEAIRCKPPATPPPGTTYTPLPYDALADTPLVPPGRISVQVLNANGLRGQAALTTAAMQQLGFSQMEAPGNDEAFGKRSAECHGQVRFGENGAGAARTVWLIDPCLQLIRDNRKDASVDLSIGTGFNDAQPAPAALEVLTTLKAWSAQRAAAGGGGEQAAGGAGPPLNEDLLDEVEPAGC
jgi:hypothetical protein